MTLQVIGWFFKQYQDVIGGRILAQKVKGNTYNAAWISFFRCLLHRIRTAI